MKVQFKKLHQDAKIPQYMTNGAAGFDLSALYDYLIYPGEVSTVSTGLSIAVEKGYELQIRSRSGLAAKFSVAVLNAPGTIDSDYRGEVKILLYNHSGTAFKVNKGERIAQGIVSPVIQAEIVEVDELDNTERGSGGFGSTRNQINVISHHTNYMRWITFIT